MLSYFGKSFKSIKSKYFRLREQRCPLSRTHSTAYNVIHIIVLQLLISFKLSFIKYIVKQLYMRGQMQMFIIRTSLQSADHCIKFIFDLWQSVILNLVSLCN